jgi:hypothetical protein
VRLADARYEADDTGAGQRRLNGLPDFPARRKYLDHRFWKRRQHFVFGGSASTVVHAESERCRPFTPPVIAQQYTGQLSADITPAVDHSPNTGE